jgi:hypothetical protein
MVRPARSGRDGSLNRWLTGRGGADSPGARPSGRVVLPLGPLPKRAEGILLAQLTGEAEHRIQGRQLEKSVSWSGRERLRCLWYRLRLTVAEMNYATRRMAELQARG